MCKIIYLDALDQRHRSTQNNSKCKPSKEKNTHIHVDSQATNILGARSYGQEGIECRLGVSKAKAEVLFL